MSGYLEEPLGNRSTFMVIKVVNVFQDSYGPSGISDIPASLSIGKHSGTFFFCPVYGMGLRIEALEEIHH